MSIPCKHTSGPLKMICVTRRLNKLRCGNVCFMGAFRNQEINNGIRQGGGDRDGKFPFK